MPGYGNPNPMLGGRDRIAQALMNIQNPPPGGPGGGMGGGMMGGAMGGGFPQPAPVGGMAGAATPMPGSMAPMPMNPPQGGMGAPGMNLPGVDVNSTPPGVKQQVSRGY
jgi:hypothetical protein